MMPRNLEPSVFNDDFKSDAVTRPSFSRRGFLKTGLLAMASCALPLCAHARTTEKRIQLFNTHTHETLDVCYCRNGRYRQDRLEAINHILRDHRTGEVKPISPRLIDLLHAISRRVHGSSEIHIISGFRSPETNASLRKKSRGVAKKSFHMLGHAVDIRIPDLQTAKLRSIAQRLRAGGVGYYPSSDFVHVDIGPVRSW